MIFLGFGAWEEVIRYKETVWHNGMFSTLLNSPGRGLYLSDLVLAFLVCSWLSQVETHSRRH